MAKQKKKSVHLHMNLGTLIFLIIVIYLMAYILSYLGKSKLAIYEVSASDIVDSIDGTGVILRKETLVHTEQSGYINYYVQEGSMVRQNGTVYTVDTTGKVRKYLKQMLEKKNSVSQDEKEQVVEKLKVFSEGYTDNNFSLLYETQNDISSTLLAYTDTMLAQNKEELAQKYGQSAYITAASPKEGLDWQLMIPVNKNDYDRLKKREEDRQTIQVTFHKDNFVAAAQYHCLKQNDSYYVILSFDNYIQRYLNQRYLYVSLTLSETKGLKIPSSSLVKKEVYKIPKSFLVNGGNSDEDYVYVYSANLTKGTVLSETNKEKIYTLKNKSQIQGVYIVNRGYTVFKQIEMVERNEDYCIVSAKNSGIELYDRIILNSDTVKEDQVIY